jgi:hypothetical protein
MVVPQVSLYLDADTMALVQKRAEAGQRSLSRYVAELIREDVSDAWPAGYWSLYGSVSDDSFARPDQLDDTLDAPRSQL